MLETNINGERVHRCLTSVLKENLPELRFVYQYRTFLVCIKIFHHIDEFNVSFSRVLCAFLEGKKIDTVDLEGICHI